MFELRFAIKSKDRVEAIHGFEQNLESESEGAGTKSWMLDVAVWGPIGGVGNVRVREEDLDELRVTSSSASGDVYLAIFRSYKITENLLENT